MYQFEIRVPYAHVDQMGVVYYAHYFVYFEMARAAFLREEGMPYGDMEKRGVLLPVVEAHCEYLKPAHYDELLTVRSRCDAFEGPRLRIDYELMHEDVLLARGYTCHVCMSPAGRPMRPTAEIRALVRTGPGAKGSRG